MLLSIWAPRFTWQEARLKLVHIQYHSARTNVKWSLDYRNDDWLNY